MCTQSAQDSFNPVDYLGFDSILCYHFFSSEVTICNYINVSVLFSPILSPPYEQTSLLNAERHSEILASILLTAFLPIGGPKTPFLLLSNLDMMIFCVWLALV